MPRRGLDQTSADNPYSKLADDDPGDEDPRTPVPANPGRAQRGDDRTPPPTSLPPNITTARKGKGRATPRNESRTAGSQSRVREEAVVEPRLEPIVPEATPTATTTPVVPPEPDSIATIMAMLTSLREEVAQLRSERAESATSSPRVPSPTTAPRRDDRDTRRRLFGFESTVPDPAILANAQATPQQPRTTARRISDTAYAVEIQSSMEAQAEDARHRAAEERRRQQPPLRPSDDARNHPVGANDRAAYGYTDGVYDRPARPRTMTASGANDLRPRRREPSQYEPARDVDYRNGPRRANGKLQLLGRILGDTEPLVDESPYDIIAVRNMWPAFQSEPRDANRRDSAKVDWSKVQLSLGHNLALRFVRDSQNLQNLAVIQQQLLYSQVPYRQWALQLSMFLRDDFADANRFISLSRCSWLYAVEAVLTILSDRGCLNHAWQQWELFVPIANEGRVDMVRRWRRIADALPADDQYDVRTFDRTVTKMIDFVPSSRAWYRLLSHDDRPRNILELLSWLIIHVEDEDRDLAAQRTIYGQPAGYLDMGGQRYQYAQQPIESTTPQPIKAIDTQYRLLPAETIIAAGPQAKIEITNPLVDDVAVMPARPDSVCYRCNRQGHFASDCIANSDRDGNTLSSEKRGGANRDRRNQSRGRGPRSDSRDRRRNRKTAPHKGDKGDRVLNKDRAKGKGRPKVHAARDDDDSDNSDDSNDSDLSEASSSDDDDELTAHLAQTGSSSRHQ